MLDVSGLFVNDAQLAPGQLAAPTLINGGSISLVAGPGTNWVKPPFSYVDVPPAGVTDLSGNITLSAGSLLNISKAAATFCPTVSCRRSAAARRQVPAAA